MLDNRHSHSSNKGKDGDGDFNLAYLSTHDHRSDDSEAGYGYEIRSPDEESASANDAHSEGEEYPGLSEVSLDKDNQDPEHHVTTGCRKYGERENRRMLRNVIIISFCFTLLFTAFNSMSNLQSSLNSEV